MDKEKQQSLEQEVWGELKDLGITPRFETLEDFDKFLTNPDSVLKLKF